MREMQQSVELVFRYGKYGCLGKTIAAIELNKVFGEVCFLLLFSCKDRLGYWLIQIQRCS